MPRPLAILALIAVVSAVAGALAAWMARARWEAATRDHVARLGAAAAAAAPGVAFRASDTDTLPPPVARFFRAALREGQLPAARVRIRWRGHFNMGGPGRDAWRPFTAVQEFAPGAPGFVWDARIRMAPGLTVFVRDALVGDHASMRAALLGLVTIVRREGTPELAAGARVRYFAEAAWFPTALLPASGVRWEAVDDAAARAVLDAGGTTVSLRVAFGADSLIASLSAPDRMYDDGRHPPAPRPWRARLLKSGVMAGMRIPLAGVVEWDLPDGTFAYWRGEPESIELEAAPERGRRAGSAAPPRGAR
uniref:Uncharacterized protein n=1 Tax=Eiseniibacteriota bacterium TaxID=2212470 RepID=A0A832I0B3_UNCEI